MVWALLQGQQVEQCPEDVQIMLVLRAFPGYTRETLLQEPAWFVERVRRFLLLEARHGP